MWIDDEVDYKRKIIKIYLNDKEVKYDTYSEVSKSILLNYIKCLPANSLIEIVSEEECEGFGYGRNVIYLRPFIEREENDEEYNKRIQEEEEEYAILQERKRLVEEENAQYLKDMKEYERIKDKYHLI